MEQDLSLGCLRQNHKRTHDQMSGGDTGSQPPWIANLPEPSSRSAPSSSNFAFRVPSFRFPGDGLDLRRPVMSQPSQNVIDLTGEPDSPPRSYNRPSANPHPTSNRASRPPRFPRNIIDIIEDEDILDQQSNGESNTSPDIEVLSSRPLRPEERPQPRLPGIAGYTGLLRPNVSLQEPGRSRSQDTSHSVFRPAFERISNFITSAPNVNPQRAREVLDAEGLQQARQMVLRDVERRGQHITIHLGDHDLNDDVAFLGAQPGFVPPRDLNWDAAAFYIGNEPHYQPPAPTYEAPPPARKGFTRSPREGDTAVCPNCDDELGAGEDDIKRQVWAVKSCGHVYCGDCTINRFKRRGKQPRITPAKTFSKCVVEGCGKQSISSPRSMFQVFL